MKNYRGMTLLEVLVALAIFSLAALALLQSLGHLALGPGRLADKTYADWVAENQMVELRLQSVWPPLAWTQGSSEQAGRTWYWRWRGVEGELPELRALEVEVSATPWQAGGTPLTVLRSYVMRP
ncbi:type II secretion system minor pseudopilin GspI [Cedecea colo]|uniref:Type II secretion system protein I n=1 Tax=Cedecea colo TaxID=2552946 RepID=A0ABX0VGN7_9ENTR|nr:type II secretion system minor pseudopilin GspI [Cedecea colo]NIY46294.1 type II secretion system protein GspI [Cedecea colo]